jgi:hypothetical protein
MLFTIEKQKDINHQVFIRSQQNLLKQGVEQFTLRSINIILFWNMEELLEEWKESIMIPVCKNDDKTDCSNYRGIALLSTMYKIVSVILLSRLTPYV